MARIPVSPYISWPLLCFLLVLVVYRITCTMLFPELPQAKVVRLQVFFVISWIVIVYEIIGIIVGQRWSKALEASLPQMLGDHYERPLPTLDQFRLEAWGTTLPWNERLRRVWRFPGILVIACVGGAIGFGLGYSYFSEATSKPAVALALGIWVGFGGFWGAPALYHLSSASWFIHRLSTQCTTSVFGNAYHDMMRLAFRYFLLYSGAAVLWAVAAILSAGLISATLWFGSVMSLFALLGLAVPSFSVLTAVARRREEMLRDILRRIESTYRTNASAVPTLPLPDLMDLYRFVVRNPRYGILRIAAKSAGPTLLPVSPSLFLQVAGYLFPHWDQLQSILHHLQSTIAR